MDLTLESNALKDNLAQANQIVIAIPDTANKDVAAAALSVYLSLQALQKNPLILYPKKPIVDWGNLVGVNKITQNVGNKNFIVSLDYIEGSIEKVSYNIENNKFNLVIEPRPGAPIFDEKKVKYSYAGVNTDLIIVVGAKNLDALGKFYTDNKSLFETKPIVAISNILGGEIGKVNIVRPVSTVSEIMTHLLSQMEMPMDTDIATNLWSGIISGSLNFSNNQVDADTFEAAAIVLKHGARKEKTQPQIREEIPSQEFALNSNQEKPQAPPDWLKPKIFKGSSLL